MTESAILNADCSKCRYSWKPYGLHKYIVPHEDNIKCPKCGNIEKMEWYDSDTNKKQLQQKLGLLGDNELIKKVSELEKRLSLVERELDIEKRKRELSEDELKAIKEWAKTRELDFKEIELLAEEERQRISNNEDMK